MPVCVARAGQEGGACMLVVLAGHDGSHGCAAPGPARMCRCCSGVTGFPRCSLLLRVRVRTCGGGPCLQGWVRWGGGGGLTRLASLCTWKNQESLQVFAGSSLRGPSCRLEGPAVAHTGSGEQPQWAQGKRLQWQWECQGAVLRRYGRKQGHASPRGLPVRLCQ